MNGVHDLGGTDGLGPVVVEKDEPVWHADWEKAAFTMFPTNFAKGYFGVDAFRFGIEQMAPADPAPRRSPLRTLLYRLL
jgi:hypothetical protein